MKVESTRLLIVLVCLIIRITNTNGLSKRPQCHDFAGDRSNCQRFIRCFYNLRVVFTCASGTAYVPELQTCVAKELVTDLTISSNDTLDENDDYPTIEADLDVLEAPMQKSLSPYVDISVTSRRFGCSSFCYNDGICVLVGQSITCRCQPGYIGVRCQVAQSAISTRQQVCGTLICENGGTCFDPPGPVDPMCNCAVGWTGPFCDSPDTTPIPTTTTTTGVLPGQQCRPNGCLNGGTCTPTPVGGGYYCTCPPGYTGPECGSLVSVSPGTTGCGTANPCLNAGVCVSTLIGYQCQCSSSFGGSNCQTNTALAIRNQCLPNPCQNGGSCYLTQTGFACVCPTSYSGTCCEINLAVSNPCYNRPCQNGGTCQVVAPLTYRCVCLIGFIGVQCDQRVCDPNPCLYGGVCLPYGNSFQCQCPAQYTGRCCELLLVTTAAPNPCSSQPCLNGGTCSATSSTAFVCSCTPSYYGRCCELRNYCQPNPCYNGGTCIATTNAYLCQCVYPYSGSNCEITLPTRPPQPTCPCIMCPCPTVTAATYNPCLPNPCQNNGGCSVAQNNAQCYCQSAFTGYYCEYPRKRSLSNIVCANMKCLNGGKCYVNDTEPRCDCPKPYFGEHCELINRPRTCNPSPCGQYGQCITTKDGYKCICKNDRTGVLCEQLIMPKNYRWCSLDCPSGTTCVYEGSTPTCRLLSVY
ncbi:unnamed protein product [Rotaria sordida]|uniref:EGF-like domain-containing protein n=1 Tax=Rotaria sordida TaxID=392033 RepID=A0A813UAF5_9BILA|nr:unnamed protein product [Rotaria sordida]